MKMFFFLFRSGGPATATLAMPVFSLFDSSIKGCSGSSEDFFEAVPTIPGCKSFSGKNSCFLPFPSSLKPTEKLGDFYFSNWLTAEEIYDLDSDF